MGYKLYNLAMDSMSGPQPYFLGYICLHLLSLDYFDMKKA